MIRIGSAGWSYPDFEGIVYPRTPQRGFDPLAFLAGFLDLVEINASFYRIPHPRATSSWAERVSGNHRFLFTAKLWRGFTHETAALTPEIAASAEHEFREAMRPLVERSLLGAVLVQFPYSFHNTAVNRARLSEIIDRFSDMPLAVEIRHASWLEAAYIDFLRERGIAFCNVDQPAVSSNIPPTAHVTAGFAYARLHGRNQEDWFEEGAGRDRRYDYLYSAEELSGWVVRIADMAAGAKDVFIVANNHYRGQGVANAVELKASVEKIVAEAPADLIATYPRLARCARPTHPSTSESGRTIPPSQGILPLS